MQVTAMSIPEQLDAPTIAAAVAAARAHGHHG